MLVLISFFIISFSLFLLSLFFSLAKYSNFDTLFNSSFECGFTSYFFSRFSFSVHYFLIGMIFLFLDLELCYLLPFMNESYSSLMILNLFLLFVISLLLGLFQEWASGLLDWKF